jgi:hypothetical protein
VADDREQHPLLLRTHTSLWQVEKRLYKVYDYTLPMPVSLKQLGFFLAFTIPWWMILKAVGLPFASPWHLIWLAPPAVATFFASRPVAEGKRLGELVWSQGTYLSQPRVITGAFQAFKEPEVLHVTAAAWTPDR